MHDLVRCAHKLLVSVAATASEAWKWNALDVRLEELYRVGQQLIKERPATQFVVVNSVLEASKSIIEAVDHRKDPISVERSVTSQRDSLKKLLRKDTPPTPR